MQNQSNYPFGISETIESPVAGFGVTPGSWICEPDDLHGGKSFKVVGYRDDQGEVTTDPDKLAEIWERLQGMR